MTVALVFLVLGLGMLLLGRRKLRSARNGDWVRQTDARLLVTTPPREQTPQLSVELGAARLLEPIQAHWTPAREMRDALRNPQATIGRPGGAVASGSYRVLAVVDLEGTDLFGLGGPLLDQAVRSACGKRAMILESVAGGPSILLHGMPRGTTGSVAGIGIEGQAITRLLNLLGDPRKLRVEVVRRDIERRDIERGGWGAQQPRRRKAR